MSPAPIIEQLNLHQIERGQISRFWLELTTSGLGNPLRVPLLVARGWEDGPILGVTAVVHGNSLNGLPVVRQLFQHLDMDNLNGTVVGIPVMNMPGFLRQERPFLDGADLNQIMPGRQGGSVSEMYTYRLMDRIISILDYLVDVQTADFGQAVAYYLKGDWVESERTLVQLLRRNPRDVDAGLMLATLWRRAGRLDESARHLQRLRGMEESARWRMEIHRETELIARAEQEAGSAREPAQDEPEPAEPPAARSVEAA